MKYLKVFTDFLEVAEPLSDEERGRLFMAMLNYALDGSLPELTGNERFVWAVAKQHIDREVAAYKTKVEADRRNGRKGATIRWSKVAKDGDPYPDHSQDSQDNDNEKEKNNDNDKDNERESRGAAPPVTPAAAVAARAHTIPSLSEVESYCRERRNQVNPQRFMDFYTANGWRVGKNPMKDWKAAVRSWESNGMDRERGGGGRELSVDDNFRIAMEMIRQKEAKEV